MRVGLVVNVLDEEYQISIYKGIKKRIEETGIQLICIQQENAVFSPESFVAKVPKSDYFDLDGLIVLSSVLMDDSELRDAAQVRKIWGDIPIISLGQKIEGIPSLMIQTDDSMKQLVEHLILVHKYRKFLFISGSENHYDAMMREKILFQTMEAYKPWFPELECVLKRGRFMESSGIQAMTEYYEENKTSPDAVVCANDNMAIGVYKFFSIHHDDIGIKECAVTGFDDIPQSRFVIPSLTTIRQPLDEIGAKAVDSIIALMNGEEIPMESYVESKVILRKSCGCKVPEENGFSVFEDMQANYVQSEQMLRLVSHVGQTLNYAEDENGLKLITNNYVEQLGIKNLCILKFVKHITAGSDCERIIVHPIYVRRNNRYFYEFYGNKDLSLGEFYKKYMEYDAEVPQNLVYKFLNIGTDLIGCVLYDATGDVLPYLCSISISIAQSLNRIEVTEERRQRSEYLEKEVNKRTKELMEANNRRMEVEAEVLKISEIERQRFSTDLHDDICQRLAGISMLCRSYSNSNEPVDKVQMGELAGLISDTLARTRQYAHNSYPVDLDSLGLNHSISNLCNSVESQFGLSCVYEWKLEDDYKFNNIQKLNIFRIIQEALHNVSKHAKATQVLVKLFRDKNENDEDCIKVIIVDDGCGLPESSLKAGLGFNSMQYRANQIGASFKIFANNPKGTCVEVCLKSSII